MTSGVPDKASEREPNCKKCGKHPEIFYEYGVCDNCADAGETSGEGAPPNPADFYGPRLAAAEAQIADLGVQLVLLDALAKKRGQKLEAAEAANRELRAALEAVTKIGEMLLEDDVWPRGYGGKTADENLRAARKLLTEGTQGEP